jgi:hypothetical protein
MKTNLYVCCGYSDSWSESVIVAVLQSVTRKILLRMEKALCAAVTVIFGVYNSVRVL